MSDLSVRSKCTAKNTASNLLAPCENQNAQGRTAASHLPADHPQILGDQQVVQSGEQTSSDPQPRGAEDHCR